MLKTYKRIDELDYLRGFALLGILLMNAVALLSLEIPQAGTGSELYQRLLYLLAEARFFSIFSFLFGVGFYLFVSRANGRGRNGYVLFLIRLAILLGFGLLHSMYHPGEALTVYAVCGLLLLPFYKVNYWVNAIIGALLLVTFAILNVKLVMPLPYMLLGIAAGQSGLFQKLGERRWALLTVTGAFTALAAVGLLHQYSKAPSEPFLMYIIEGLDDHAVEQGNLYLKAGLLVSPVVAFAYMSILLLLLQSSFFRGLLFPMKSVGRMALTNYIGQTVMVLVAGKWLGLAGTSNWLSVLWLCLGIYVAQLLFSSLWMRWFAMGPLEWLWRAGTYFELPPLLRRTSERVKGA